MAPSLPPRGTVTPIQRQPVSSARGFTLIELVIVTLLLGLISAIALPGLMRARVAGNEASGISTLRAINSAQVAYSLTCGHGAFAATLRVLGMGPLPDNVPFISPDVTSDEIVTKSGYTTEMRGVPIATAEPSCNGGDLVGGYWARNYPATQGVTGDRYFWTNGSGGIYGKRAVFTSTNVVGKPDADPDATPVP